MPLATSLELSAQYLLVLVGIGGIFVATLTLRKIERQTKATEAAVELANVTLNSTFRPKLRIRGLRLSAGMPITQPVGEIVNIGDTDATIIASHCQIVCCTREADAIGEFDDGTPNNPIAQCEIKGGGSVKVGGLKFDEAMHWTKLKFEGNGGRLYALGWVRYRDKNGTIRRTGFCRQRDPDTGLFYAGRGTAPDYEYED